ncbi:BglG family transcription antiterminator LicT [Clostridium sp.]|uniref:BglG family transcription antiterminator LicT n=1 Tax=Clostridium sp. TaxID=1506 RepID=UPI001D289737|nr:PRD domain-containing protein [Clostridium sp.]MBS5938649.1 PRD domain-containing protein [Clostridium sp.]
MKVKRILNNNVVVAIENEQEKIVMGRGLSFSLKRGDEIPNAKIEKIFDLRDQEETNYFSKLLSEIPLECFTFTEKAVDYAKVELGRKLHNSIYITLTDHINTMVERGKSNAYIKNPMLWDIKRLYKSEFKIALKIIEEFNKLYGTIYDENEVARIALHIVNSELEMDISNTIEMTKIITEILNIVKYYFKITYNEDSLAYYRFIVHLQFFVQRIVEDSTYSDSIDSALNNHIIDTYNESYKCALKIKEYVMNMYNHSLDEEEVIYLTIHINKVLSESKKHIYK